MGAIDGHLIFFIYNPFTANFNISTNILIEITLILLNVLFSVFIY